MEARTRGTCRPALWGPWLLATWRGDGGGGGGGGGREIVHTIKEGWGEKKKLFIRMCQLKELNMELALLLVLSQLFICVSDDYINIFYTQNGIQS